MTRVAFIAHSPGKGGAERSLQTLVQSLDRNRIDPVVFGTAIIADAQSVPIRFPWWVDTAPHFDNFNDFINGLEGRVSRLCRLFQEERIELVFTNSSVVADAGIAATLIGIPHVWHCRELYQGSHDLSTGTSLKHFFSLMRGFSTVLTANSRAVAGEIETYLPESKVSVIYNGFPAQVVSPDKTNCFHVQNSQPVIGFFGELSERKGIFDFIQMAALVNRAFPEAVFALVGADVGCNLLIAARLRSLGLESQFRMVGLREDPLPFIASCDVVVVPSLVEPFSRVIVEAMLQKRPIVATRCGGPAEILAHETTGLLAETGNTDQIAGAVLRILRDPTLARNLGDAAFLDASDRFTERNYAAGFESVFNAALAARDGHEKASAAQASNQLLGAIALLTRLSWNPSLVKSRLLEDELIHTRQALAESRFQLEKKTRELQAVHASNSWKLGRAILDPLARMVSAAKGLKQIPPMNS